MQVTAVAQQLVGELLGLYTADAAKDLPHRVNRSPNSAESPLIVLQMAMAYKVNNTDAEHNAAIIRRTALSQVSAAVYGAVPAETQERLLLVSLWDELACVCFAGVFHVPPSFHFSLMVSLFLACMRHLHP